MGLSSLTMFSGYEAYHYLSAIIHELGRPVSNLVSFETNHYSYVHVCISAAAG